MDWLEFRITVQPELVEPLVELFRKVLKQAPAIEEAGGFNPDEGETAPLDGLVTIRAYTRANRWASGRQARVEAGLQLLSMICPLPPLETHRIRDQEWEEAWREHFQPLRIGQRLVVRIKELEYVAQEGDVVVTLDSGMAFGTGHHPTTRMCLEELEGRLRPDARVLDMGAGSGILAVAAAGLGAALVLAVEKDPSAVRVARRNARASGVARRVRVVRGDRPPEDGGLFDLVVANISAKVLMGLAEDLARCLAPGGVLIASGLLEERADEVAQRFLEAGLQVEERRQEEDWVALVCVVAAPER
jgi:ribosomal protein L11 methyltransferase